MQSGTGGQDPGRAYLPIAEHGLVGDLRTSALIGSDGRVDWFCCPRFDSPSVFGSVLDAEDGGVWSITPEDPFESRQLYLPDTNVLVTRFLTPTGVTEVHDLMPLVRRHDPDHVQRLVRRVVSVRGSMRLRVRVAPRFDYGRADHAAVHADGVTSFVTPGLTLRLSASTEVTVTGGEASAEVELHLGESAVFVLDVVPDGQRVPPGVCTAEQVQDLEDRTVAFWQGWLSRCTYRGRWREMVHRSALTLKLLTHEPTGAVVAAPTAGLPEEVGGSRNWDYRFVWIRDAAFSLYALLRLGFTDEADAFMSWLTDRFAGEVDPDVGPLRVLYSIDGDPVEEVVLEHWEGYRGSSPVRIGNDAVGQLQLDIYGELIDSVYLFNKYGTGISYDAWTDLTRVVAWLAENWRRPDEGIWEVRSQRRHHTFSRLMSWVAMERMVRMSRARGLPGDLQAWARTRDEIFVDIMENGWDPQARTFVQHYGGQHVDASLLMIPMVKLLAPTDPRFTSTLAAVEAALVTDALVFRYDVEAGDDGLDGEEGTFSICSFWYVEALTRVGRLPEARLALEKMFTYANPVGLYAEQVGLAGEQLGNFPQAFTHLSLISAALNLDRALG